MNIPGLFTTYNLATYTHGCVLHNDKVAGVAGLRLTEDESDYLWEKRNYLYDYPSALPRMIQVWTAISTCLPFCIFVIAVVLVKSHIFDEFL